MSQEGQFRGVGSSSHIMRQVPRQEGWTNQPIVVKRDNKNMIYMPCYVRTKLKNLVSLDQKALKGKMNLAIIITIHYGEFDELYPLLFQQLQEKIILKFKIDPSLRLKQGFNIFKNDEGQKCSDLITKKINYSEKLLTFSIRKILTAPLNCQIFWSPFQFIEYVMTLNLQSVKFRDERVYVYFNMMNINSDQSIQKVASYTQEGALGQYDLAENLIKVQFSNIRIFDQKLKLQQRQKQSQKNTNYERFKASFPLSLSFQRNQLINYRQSAAFQTKNKLKAFQYGHFVYPVYRQALVPMVALFFPIVILGMMNLGVFFQNQRVGKRLLNISAIMVSYVSFLPIIRQKLPPSNKLVISQLLLFSMASMTLFTLAHSIKVKKMGLNWRITDISSPQFYKIVWYEQTLFIIAMILTFVIIAILIYISLLYTCHFYKYFNKPYGEQDIKFDRTNWKNKLCDKYFSEFADKGENIVSLKQFYKSNKQKKSKRQINGQNRSEMSRQEKQDGCLV